MPALGVVEDEVRELVRRRGRDPEVDGAAIRRLIDEVLAAPRRANHVMQPTRFAALAGL